MEYVDSNQQKLNLGEILLTYLSKTQQPYPPKVMMPAILDELHQPNVEQKQIGNTVFEVITGDGDKAFFKAFNADTGPNFVENSKQFVVWAKKDLGLKILMTQFRDPAIEKLFKVISMNPPMQGMGYQVFHMESGDTRIIMTLGE